MRDPILCNAEEAQEHAGFSDAPGGPTLTPVEEGEADAAEEAKPEPVTELEEAPAEDLNARQEADAATRDRQLIEREAALKVREEQAAQWEEIRGLAGENPAEAARRLGIDPGKLAEQYMGVEKEPTEQDNVQAAVQAAMAPMLQQMQAMQEETSRHRAHAELGQMVQADPEKYALVETIGPAAMDEVRRRASDFEQRTRMQADMPAILAQVEEEYTQNVFAGLERLVKVPSYKERIQKLLGSPTNTPAKKDIPPAAPGQKPQTLSSEMEGEAAKEQRLMTEDEEMTEAARIIREDIARQKGE
ncbi:hypothetical protein CMI37_37755 [Candidatus Pacearchaeota archaeon]|nr:hypothetical protein [Candidatus Pacearchaeota archaeon]